MHEAANLPECECDVDISVQRMFEGFHLAATRPAVQIAERALRSSGHEPLRISSGGASDANALLVQGIEVVNLANGTERAHEPQERVSVVALEGMLDVALALLDAAASEPSRSRLRPRLPRRARFSGNAQAAPRESPRRRVRAGRRAAPADRAERGARASVARRLPTLA